MIKKLFCSILFFPYFLFSQTFTNNIVEPAGNWNATLTKTITVSGLPILQTGVFELNQVNLHLGDDLNSRNYNSYRITLQKGSVVIDLVAVGGFPNSTIRQINTKFRYNTVLRRLFEHGGTTEPFHIGYYRSQDDFSLFNGFDPNGVWTITITETSFATGGKFNSIELKFGAPLQTNNQTLNTSYDSCSTPLCLSSNEITIATNNGLTSESTDMFNGNTSNCSWNAAQNNSAWFKFVASQSTAKITISGISGNIQILAVSPGIDNNICTPIDNVLINGGCPEDLINDSYFSPQYLNGSTRNNQLNLSGLNIGQEYYFIVDGTGGAISPFYIELEGVNQSCNCFIDVPIIINQPATCSSAGVSTITNYNGALTYVFTPSGPTVGAGGLISGMTFGTSYTVTSSNGSCSSVASASFSNAAQLTTPAVPTITTTTPTCSVVGTSTITNYNGALTYVFTPSGPTVGAGGLISGMTVGTSYTVTAGNGTCTSASSASFTNLATLSVPSQPMISTTAATCSSAGVSTITNYNGALTYVFTPSGPTVGAGGLISGMTFGTSYTVTSSNGSCSSVASASFSNATILNTPAAATASVTAQPTCLIPTGTIVITAPLGGNLEYSINNGVSYQSSTTFTGLAPNSTYTIVVRNTTSGCTSSPISLSIDSVPPSPIISTVSGCNGANFEITASVASGVATYEWYNSSSSLIGTTATIAVTSSGTYEVRATVNSCTTIEFVNVVVSACVIPKGVSPNNDGLNDTWDLSGLNANKVQIFNRYGVEVYSKNNYTNEWDGKSNSGNELPDGTYYYVISLPGGTVKTGWVYINKEN